MSIPKATWCWEHTTIIESADKIKEQAEQLHEDGFKYVFPVVNYLETLPEFRPYKDRDPLTELTEALDGSDVKVHPWVTVAIRDKLGPLLKDRDDLKPRWNDNGTPRIYSKIALCMAQPEVQAYKLELYRNLTQKYNLDGVHLDFIRWVEHGNDNDVLNHQETIDACVCDHCRGLFKNLTGEDLLKVTARPGSTAWKEWIKWRCDIITAFVERLYAQCKLTDHRISGAVFSGYPRWPLLVGQDWKSWVDRGLIDMVCPMDYGKDPDSVNDHTIANVRACAGKSELWVGIYKGYGAYPNYSTEELEALTVAVKNGHADGLVVFNWEAVTKEDREMLAKY